MMLEVDSNLRQLFNAVDTDGSGTIGVDEVRDICSKFGIGPVDADSIFKNLDKDGDGLISFGDFEQGFDEYEQSVLTGSSNSDSLSVITKQLEQEAQSRNNNRIGKATKGITSSSQKRNTMQVQLELSSEAPDPQFIQDLIDKVNKLKDENQRLAQSWVREKHEHEKSLHQLEEEMDSQVKEVELRVKEKAKIELEAERKSMRDLMKDEMDELQAHLTMFEKVDLWLKANHTNQHDEKLNEFRSKLDEALQENKQMRFSLMDTQTTVALMRNDLVQMRTQYETKCKELALERERALEAAHEQEYLSQQLHVLQESNRRLQDTTDTIQEVRSNRRDSGDSRQSTRRKRGSILGDYIAPVKSSSIDHRIKINEIDVDIDDTGSVSSYSSVPVQGWSVPRQEDEFDSGLSSNVREEDLESSGGGKLPRASPRNSIRRKLVPDLALQRTLSSDGIYKMAGREAKTRSYDSRLNSAEDGPFVSESSSPPGRTFKVIFIGDASVGKTSFIWRIAKNSFASNLGSTLGVDFQIKTLAVDGDTVALQLWDTAGQERFRSITKSYFRKADGILLLYDVSNERSFLNVRQWISDVEEMTEKTVPLMLVANKSDLREKATEENREFFITTENGSKLAEQHKVDFLETSVKDGSNTFLSIGKLIKKMMENEDQLVSSSGLVLGPRRNSKLFECCSRRINPNLTIQPIAWQKYRYHFLSAIRKRSLTRVDNSESSIYYSNFIPDSIMAANEVDQLMMTAIKLLHSKAPDSADQLKAMLDDALAQRRGVIKGGNIVKIERKPDLPFKPIKEPEKRPFERVGKIKQEMLEPIEIKRPKIDSPITVKSRSITSSPDLSRPSFTPSEDSKDTDIKSEKVEEDSDATDIEQEEQETDAGDFALELGLACVICKGIDVQSGNQLVECQDCHSLYHQDCHKPPATEQDINDPRFVWYCAKCTKTQKKITSKSAKVAPVKPVTMSASSAFEAAINQGKESAMQLVKAAKEKEKAKEISSPAVQPFKRTELKSPLPGTLAQEKKPMGLAGLAHIAKTTAQPTPTSSSSSTSSNSSAADKRLQQMKKKAAKANEKKKSSK
ncbi:Ras and EF-hand domain-containing protein [Halotydeus destructor]|nr:Ras and EF-hand domain-containing protein [Halotydeus destructor]